MGTPTLNERADGYRGLWYQREKLPSEYRYKYSGGLGTYCAKHQPFAIYCPEVDQTFFCYGGVRSGYHQDFELTLDNMDPIEAEQAVYHYVSAFDHATGTVDRPTVLLDKRTHDAHDNPVITVDGDGFVWVISTSHGPLRPAYVHRSVKPYDVTEFQMMEPYQIIDGIKMPITNFSYMQVWYRRQQGFTYFFTVYSADWNRKTYFASSQDGIEWSPFVQIADIDKGHYQVSAVHWDRAGTAFNYHPLPVGLNARTNLYFVETTDDGATWTAADGTPVQLPLIEVNNATLVHDFEAEGLLVYMKDMVYDAEGRPLILFITSTGFESGPENGPRTWSLARWTGTRWRIHEITTSDSNYDMGSLYVESDGVKQDGLLRLVAPTETGAQAYNPGGEVAMWVSSDDGRSWTMERQVTEGGPYNHTYVRRPVNAHPDFYALWADGHAREPSPSRLYFCSKAGDLFQLPKQMSQERQAPLKCFPAER